MIVNKTQLADVIGRSEEWITQAQKDQTFPVLERNRSRAGNRYETQDVIRWMNQREVQDLVGDNINIEEAKRRKLAAEAALAETELAQVQGKLLDAEEAAKQWAELIANCRAKLLAIPAKASGEIFAAESLVEVKTILKKMIIEALNELSGDRESITQSSAGVSPTA
jgi:hypothetical protein